MIKSLAVLALIVVAVNADVSHLLRKQNYGSVKVNRAANNAPGQEANAQILRQESDIQPEGSYSWSYETDNGISANEAAQIQVKGPEEAQKTAQGQFQWTSPEGEAVQISYIADENGYQPQGANLPTPPPAPEIPAAIQRALDYIAAHPPPPEVSGKF